MEIKCARARACVLSDSYQGKVSDSVSRPEETRAAERDAVQRRKRPKPRKPYDLDSEGEETSDESSSEKVKRERLCPEVMESLIIDYICFYSNLLSWGALTFGHLKIKSVAFGVIVCSEQQVAAMLFAMGASVVVFYKRSRLVLLFVP